MLEAYFEMDSLKDLSNQELIQRHKKIRNLCSYAQQHHDNQSLIQYMNLADVYERELDRRIMEELIDEDELEDSYEDFV